MNITSLERKMTKKEKAKEKRLKDKYDDSDMKKSMKKQYGKDWKNVYYATIRKKAMGENILNKRFSSIMQNAMDRLQEGEAGQHDRMYKVVHAKKGMMDIKAKTSYEAAKKFAKEKGLKSTAGVDTHLYPLEEASSPWTSSGKHPEDMSREELQHEIDIFKQYEKMGMSLSPKEIMRMDSLYDYLDTVDEKCRYCGGDCPNDEENACDGYLGDIDNLYGTRTDEASNIKLPKDFFRNIASMDEPHEEIERLLTADGPEGDVIRREYDITASENGLHPDDDFEQILDFMVHDFEDMTFEGYKVLPNIDKERYTPMPGLEGPFQTMSGKPIYYDPKEGSYYDRDTDMYLTYAEFKALDDPKPNTGRMKEDSYDGANPFIYKIYNDENILLADDLESALEILDGEIPEQELEQIEDMAMSGDMDPLLSALDGFGYEIVMNEGHSPHPKGSPKYKKHMAAMHANSVDLNAMRDALKLDESVDTNTVVAQYTRATLDHRHNTWKKVCEQIDFIRSLVKDDVDIANVRTQIKRMHEQEKIDHLVKVNENIDKLRDIVNNKSAMSIKFADGSMKVDMTTANIFVQMYDRMKERNQQKIDDMMQTKAGFLKVLDFFYGAMK